MDTARYYSLQTHRRDGTAVRTPLWGFVQDGVVLMWTAASSFKVRRIRRNPTVQLAPCNATGKRILGDFRPFVADIVTDPGALSAIRAGLRGKYGLQLRLIELSLPLRGKRVTDYVGLRLRPA